MLETKPYYLIAVPEGAIIDDLKQLQQLISRTFDMYLDPYPSLHITVGVIAYNQDISLALPVLKQVTCNYTRFNVQIEGQRCFNAPFLSVGVGVHSSTLSHLAGNLEGGLAQQGFTPRPFSDWDFHISLVSPHFAQRQWTHLEYTEACRMVERFAPSGECTLDRLELWEPEFPPLNVLGKFEFKKRA
jgi:hypothetical protein